MPKQHYSHFDKTVKSAFLVAVIYGAIVLLLTLIKG